jgi:hypothetical protein
MVMASVKIVTLLDDALAVAARPAHAVVLPGRSRSSGLSAAPPSRQFGLLPAGTDLGRLPASTLTRPISTMHTAKTQSVRQPKRNRFILRPIGYHRHYGPAARIDPVVLSAITISWNNIVIPVRSWLHHGHPDERPLFTNDFGILRLRRDVKRRQIAQNQGHSESERYGLYSHALASLPYQPSGDVRLRAAVRAYRTSKAPDPQPPIL